MRRHLGLALLVLLVGQSAALVGEGLSFSHTPLLHRKHKLVIDRSFCFCHPLTADRVPWLPAFQLTSSGLLGVSSTCGFLDGE